MFKHPDCIAVGIAVHVTNEQYTVIEYTCSSAQKYTKQLWGSWNKDSKVQENILYWIRRP